MTPLESGFLLLTSQLGDPARKPLSVAQFRILASRIRSSAAPKTDRDLKIADLLALGYSKEMAQRMIKLLDEQQLLERYLSKGRHGGCVPLTRAGEVYPLRVRKCLGEDSPGCLWAKGDLSLLKEPCVSLVGSRELNDDNRRFARQVGIEAANQGFVLVSGNARGADKAAQESCLEAGGSVICVVADSLETHRAKNRVLYLSEDGFECAFSSQRALSRNRVIHSISAVTFVAQCAFHSGGTWDGTAKNLNGHWSKVFCYDDGSKAVLALNAMGAQRIEIEDLKDFCALSKEKTDLFIM